MSADHADLVQRLREWLGDAPLTVEAADAIESLVALQQRMATMLAVIAYPQRGTNEEGMDIQAAANFIRHHFTRDELGLDDTLKDAP